MKRKYYILLLNNCFDIKTNSETTDSYSVIPNVLIKEYKNLSTMQSDFMGLDDNIVIGDESWIVKGSFPIIAEEISGSMIDVVTGKSIEYSNKPNKIDDITYSKKYQISSKNIHLLLSLLDEESIKRYKKGLEDIERYTVEKYSEIATKEEYFYLVPNDNGTLTPLLITKKVNSQILDVLTNTKIYPVRENMLTSKLNYTYKTKVDKKSLPTKPESFSQEHKKYYARNIDRARNNSLRRYQNYINQNKDRNFDDRINPDTKKSIPTKIRSLKREKNEDTNKN